MASLVLGTIGSIIGGPIGGLIGSIAGSFIDRLLMPQQHTFGPRLTDRTVQAATFGQPIPIAFGAMRLAGNMIWATDLVEVANTQSAGKGGGPTITTFTYFGNFAIAVCKGPISGYLRIWADSKVIWDKRTGKVISKKNIARTLIFYFGDEVQLPDSFIESKKGVGNVPGYRGTAYVVFKRFPLSPFGNRIPLFSFEVQGLTDLDVGTLAVDPIPYFPGGGLSTLGGAPEWHPDSADASFYALYANGGATTSDVTLVNFDRTTLAFRTWTPFETAAILAALASVTGMKIVPPLLVDSGDIIWCAMDQEFGVFSGAPPPRALIITLHHTGSGGSLNWVADTPIPVPGDGRIFKFMEGGAHVIAIQGALGGTPFFVRLHYSSGAVIDASVPLAGVLPTVDAATGDVYAIGAGLGGDLIYTIVKCAVGGTTWTDVTPWTSNAEIGIGLSTMLDPRALIGSDYLCPGKVLIQAFCTQDTGIPVRSVILMGIDLSGGGAGTILWTKTINTNYLHNTQDLCISDRGKGGEAAAPGAVWMTWWDDLNLLGLGQDNVLFQIKLSDGTIDPKTVYIVGADEFFYVRSDEGLSGLSGTPKIPVVYTAPEVVRWPLANTIIQGSTLAFIVAEIQKRCGLDPSEYDVSALLPTVVPGYLIGQETSGRGAIEPLFPVFYFDGVESDWLLKWRYRDGNPTITINENDLGARSENVQQDVDKVVETRIQDVDIPNKIVLRYMRQISDYQTATQYMKRVNQAVSSTSNSSLDVPANIDDATAKAAVEKGLFLAWVGRTRLEITLPRSAIAIDPTDVITVVYENGAVSASIFVDQVDQGADLTFKISGTTTDSIAFNPTAPSDSTDFASQGSTFDQTMTLVFMDLPPLRDKDTAFGFYLAAYGGAGTWNGGTVLQSTDSGATYSVFDSFTSGPAIGAISGVLQPPDNYDLWDTKNSLVVRVINGMTLESVTPAQVLTGQNIALVGSEIIGYCTATQLLVDTWQISNFLRGIQGTEWVVHDAFSAETFVALPMTGEVKNEPLPVSLLGVAESYAGLSTGQDLTDVTPVAFTCAGIRLKPFQGYHGQITRDGSNNISLGWTPSRRTQNDIVDGIDLGVDETPEAYQIDVIVSGTPVRTLTSSTPAVAYSAANQTIDGITLGSPVEFAIYQMSSLVGRGYPYSFTG